MTDHAASNDLIQSAVDLYQEASRYALDASDLRCLAGLLAVDQSGQWMHPRCLLVPGPVLEARALAGVFLLDERVIWSCAADRPRLAAFDRLLHYAHQSALVWSVDQVSTVRGEERLTTHTGGGLAVVSSPTYAEACGLRGDCFVVHDRAPSPDQMSGILRCLGRSTRPQVVVSCVDRPSARKLAV